MIRLWAVALSRFLVGFANGVDPAVRAHICKITTSEERTAAMARMSQAQMLGILLGPAIGVATSLLGQRAIGPEPGVVFDMNTMTG